MPDETAGEGNGPLPAGPDLILPGQAVAREEGAPGFNVIKLHALRSDGTPISEDVGVGRAGFNNHSPSVSSLTPSMQVDASARVISIAWIESVAGDSSGVGRVMWQRFAADLAPANDNATWVADHNGIGVFGCEPAVAGLAGGETLLTWIDADGSAHGRLYPPDDFAVNGDADASAYAAVNASLADLGPVASTPDGSRRLQVTETRPGNLAVMWLALADHGFVMRGSMVSTPLGPSTDADSDGRWTATPIDEVRLPPGFTGPFSLQGAGDGSADVIVRYTDASSNAALAHRIVGPGSDGEVGRAGPEFVPDLEPIARETADFVRTALADLASPEDGVHTEPPQAGGQAQPVSLMLGITGALEGDPIVTATQDGFAVTWEAPGITEDAVVIMLAMFDKNGVARTLPDGSTVITVADNALAAVKPSITGAGSGAAVAYVDASERSLVVKAYDDSGTRISQDVVDDGASGAVSEIALGSTPGDDPGEEAELDVVYVRDDHDDQPDYGNIVLQRYRLPAEGDSDGLVALGGDGEADGADAPVALTNEPDADPATSEDVHGRAPAVAGLDDGDLAIVWVENDGARETIRGCVLEAGGGQVLRIDLTGLLEDSGIARGTKPILLANADGDILVSWLQRDAQDDDAYVVMAALYAATGDNQWIAPQQPMRLQSFDEEPKDFFVTWADPDGSAIDVSWSTDSSGSGSGKGLLSQRFDLDGNDVGYRKKVSPSDGDQLSTEGLSAAGLVDGQIVVVYTEQSRNGDLDLAAHVVDTQTGDTSTIDMPDPDVAGGADVAAAAEAAFSTGVDQEIAIDLATAAGATVSHVNGVPITTAAPVDVGAGWIQLREDGWLTVSPDAGYAGPIAFNYTVGGITNEPDATSRVTVNVAEDAPPALALTNLTTALAEDVSTAADIELADIDISDAEVSTENFSLAGLDADLFRIVGSTLYLKAGIDLDFDTNPKLSVEIRADRSATQNQAVNFTLDVEDANGGAALDDYLTADTFVFAPGFDEAGSIDDGAREVIDMSSSAYSTFQELLDSGALMQSGEDVVITFDPTDPDSSDRITLRGIELSVLTSADFKF